MQTRVLFGTLALMAALSSQPFHPTTVVAGESADTSNYKVLAPIRHGNLTVFPVVSAKSYDTTQFITLDEVGVDRPNRKRRGDRNTVDDWLSDSFPR